MAFDVSGIRDLWRCPKSSSKLVIDGDSAICTNAECRLSYPIRDGIPVMLIEEAGILALEDWQAQIRRAAEAGT